MVHYIKLQILNPKSSANGKWYLRAVCDETVEVEGLADHMAAHNTPYSRGVIRGVLTDMVRCIKELMLEGKAVKLADLAIFKIGLVSGTADTRKDAKTSLVTGFRFNAKGTGEMALSALKQDIRLKELKHYNGGEPIGDDEDPENDPGNEPPTGTLYTLTWKHGDTVKHTEQLAEGAAITEPAAPEEGYHWKDVPATMPGHALEIVSEADSNEPPVLS